MMFDKRLLYLCILLPSFLMLAFLLPGSSARAAEPMDQYTDNGYRWPIDITRRITSTFGEYRPDRFHAGLDFSTNGVPGSPVYAVADGYISRMQAHFSGYGRALYLTLEDGSVAVYAHLGQFVDKVEDILKAEQKRRGQFEVQMWFEPGEIFFEQGDIIAWSGGSGAGPPHLHFEMRNSMNAPVNPTLAGFVYDDTAAPYVRRLSMRPLDGDSEVEGQMEPAIRWVQNQVAEPVKFFGRVGISVEARDYQGTGWYRLEVREYELYVDGLLLHRTVLDTFPYSLNRHSRLDFDYELGRTGQRRFRRMYVTQGNKLGFYDQDLPGGILDSRIIGSGIHEVKVRLTDAYGNVGEAYWTVEALANPSLPLASEQDTLPPLLDLKPHTLDVPFELFLKGTTAEVIVPQLPDSIQPANVWTAAPAYKSPKRLVKHGSSWYTRAELEMAYNGPCPFTILVQDSAGTLHEMRRNMILMPLPAGQSVEWSFPQDGIQLNFSGTNQPWDMVAGMTINDIDTTNLAPEYTLYPHDYPFLGSYRLSILNDAKKWDPNAVMVYLEHPRSEWRYLGNRRAQNGYAMTSYALSFETFSVAVDTVQPFIRSVSPSDEIKLTSGQPMLQAVIGDDFSGLDLNLSELTVDSSDIIWEYDPDRALIFYRPWEPIEPGRHEWTIYVADNAGNTNTMTRYFTVR